jgi:hypothetical protein
MEKYFIHGNGFKRQTVYIFFHFIAVALVTVRFFVILSRFVFLHYYYFLSVLRRNQQVKKIPVLKKFIQIVYEL